MKRGANIQVALAWVLMLALAGPGCARFRKRPTPEPLPEKVEADSANAETPLPVESDNGEVTNLPPRLKLDALTVQVLQEQELNAQFRDDEADIHPRNGFTRWLDGLHQRTYRNMDNAVRRVDTLWLTEDVRPYEYELSTFKLRLLMRAGGRSNEDSTDYKVKFRADIAIPGLKRKLHLFLDNAEPDELPGRDPLEQSDDTRLGARVARPLRHSDLDLGGGVRMRSGMPAGFGELNWRWKWEKSLGGLLGLTPRVYWYSDDGFGQTTSLTWTRLVSGSQIFQFRTAEHSTEVTDGWEFEQTVRYAWLRSGRTRGWVAQASTFPHYKDSDLFFDNTLINLTLRRALYRKWIYYTLTPQVEFPVEDDYHAKPSFRIGLEILMGGKIGNLI